VSNSVEAIPIDASPTKNLAAPHLLAQVMDGNLMIISKEKTTLIKYNICRIRLLLKK
jgi:hypothetical protein